MKRLRRFLKSPHPRFKTYDEMVKQYGKDWPNKIDWLQPEEAEDAIAIFTGKIFYPCMVKMAHKIREDFYYGPTCTHVHVNMLTTRKLPKRG